METGFEKTEHRSSNQLAVKSAVHARAETLTEQLWQLDLETQISQSECLGSPSVVQVEPCAFVEVAQFMKLHGDSLYAKSPSEALFLATDVSPSRLRFYETHANLLKLVCAGQMVGVFIGHPTDWSTYYIRYIALLPQFRGKGHFQKLINGLVQTLSGVAERLEIEISPANGTQIHLLNRNGFVMTGMTLSERWGTLLRLTRFLSDRHLDVFGRQFCFEGLGKTNLASDQSYNHGRRFI